MQTCTHSKHALCVQFTVPVSERKNEREVSRGVVGSFEKDARLHVQAGDWCRCACVNTRLMQRRLQGEEERVRMER